MACATTAAAQDSPAPAPVASPGKASGDPLLAGFQVPPHEARPQTWWHWMNGNVTDAGIRADLEWMKRVGIGGVQRFDAGGVMANYAFVTPRLIVGDANWRSAVRTSVQTTDRLGLDFTNASSPGWSLTGGPWVRPEQAMKKYTWSETIVAGGRAFSGRLPAPPETTGPFQDVPVETVIGSAATTARFYSDAMVVAYRLPGAERADIRPVSIVSSGGVLDAGRLGDGRLDTAQTVLGEPGARAAWVVLRYARPVTVRAIALGIAGRAASDGPDRPRIETSDDGRTWRDGAVLGGPANAQLKVYGFAPLTARYFRVTLPPEPAPPSYEAAFAPPASAGPVKIRLSELTLHAAAMVDRFVEKAGFVAPMVYAAAPSVPDGDRIAIAGNAVIDLTSRMAADGTLRWTPASGRWRIVRLGYSLTGHQNGPAQPEATGLEVDKLDAGHIGAYLDQYLARLEAATGPALIGRKGLQNLLADSWEAGVQNWSEKLPAEFRARRGYDMLPWVPVLTGHIVGSAAESDRFLWDFRRTIQDLTAAHYKIVADALHARGMGLYAEAQGDNWRALADGMEIKSRADVPMAEYWFRPFAAGPGQPALKTDLKEAASVAHLYGKPLAAAESLTVATNTPWGYAPAQLKPVIDEIFAYGINRFVLHTSVHQPVLDRKPGLALGPFGQYINRNETWAEQAKPFFDYIARASYLLQQGRYVADVAYFYGEDRPLVSLFRGKYDEPTDRYLIEVPPGTGYDFINAETLTKAVSVEGNDLTTSGGMRYRLLFLGPDTTAMTLAMLERIETLVRQGAVVVGARPQHRLGMAGSDAAFAAAADRLWGKSEAVQTVGKGKVYANPSIADALAGEGIGADVRLVGAPDLNILQLHRRTADGRDIYFLSNRKARSEPVEAVFRAGGGRPERWDADTGRTTPLGYRTSNGYTTVPLTLDSQDSTFVVFRSDAAAHDETVAAPRITPLGAIDGAWTVRFPPGLGAPAQVRMPALASWSDNTDPGVRYFSGTARYVHPLTVPRDWRRDGRRIVLDLGQVRELAQVFVNGRDMGIAWKPPYRIDITDGLKSGDNTIEIAVTNLWPNRIIGDLQPGVTKKVSWVEASPIFAGYQWKANSPLRPSGLLGPVRLDAVDAAPPPAIK